jgi:sodium/bile acid cotransporter 7
LLTPPCLQLLRELPPLGKHIKKLTARYKTFLSMFSVVMLAMIVWQSLSGAQSTLMDQQFVQILYVILLAIAQHIIYLIFNFGALHWVFHMPLMELIATGVMSSQKSAPVAVTGEAVVWSKPSLSVLSWTGCVQQAGSASSHHRSPWWWGC